MCVCVTTQLATVVMPVSDDHTKQHRPSVLQRTLALVLAKGT